jgi:hypothetical protein
LNGSSVVKALGFEALGFQGEAMSREGAGKRAVFPQFRLGRERIPT